MKHNVWAAKVSVSKVRSVAVALCARVEYAVLAAADEIVSVYLILSVVQADAQVFFALAPLLFAPWGMLHKS